ncbi:quaternary ammonium compound-resistance protein SugE [Acinetobacter calcoaceticus]|uniref:Guanidinium exporter n=1 Tax=Acinetobacter calcoaceticus TaxID=471 RepID=A0A4R1XYT9_ACICA|nr:quaternary ammonium compound-resistance protein SugE [Acinetobacter calcoaceticus]
MAWVYLIIAGLLEIGWPLGLKYAQNPDTRIIGIIAALFFITASGAFLYLAQREIPMGTAYAVWTSIGAVGAFTVGILFYGDPSSLMRYIGVLLIVAGVVTLKMAS